MATLSDSSSTSLVWVMTAARVGSISSENGSMMIVGLSVQNVMLLVSYIFWQHCLEVVIWPYETCPCFA